MANRWCDGLGRYGGDIAKMLNGSSSQAWAQISIGFALSGEYPRTGSHALRLTKTYNLEQTARRVFGAPLTEVFLGFAVRCEALPDRESTNNGLINGGVFLPTLVDQNNSRQLICMLGTDGAIAAYLSSEFGYPGTLLGRTVPCIGAGAYQHIEIYAKAGASGDGALEIRVDEVTRLNLTGITTVRTANVEFSQARWGRYDLGFLPGAIDFADFYCNDSVDDGSGCSTFIGDVKSAWLPVNANTAQADLTLSAGASGYALLAGTPPDDSTYITTEDTTAESHFGLADPPENLSEILTVRPAIRAWKDDAGSISVAPNVESDATKGTVTAQPITTAPAYYDSNVPLDPATGAPWSKEGLEAALNVVERTA